MRKYGQGMQVSQMAEHGMVASAHDLASWVGAQTLIQGGGAADAALSMAFVTGVVLPQMCGLGGDAFCLYYDAKTHQVTAYESSGPTARGAFAQAYRDRGHDFVPEDGIHSIAVPGAVALYDKLWRDHGHWDWQRLVAPAVRIAREGFAVSPGLSEDIGEQKEKLSLQQDAANVFLSQCYAAGDLLVQTALAESLQTLADGGAESFYHGVFSEKFSRWAQSMGGFFEGDEWGQVHVNAGPGLSTTYRGKTIYQLNPPSQGMMHLETLNLFEEVFVGSALDPDGLHWLVESFKQSVYDRIRIMGESSTMFDKARQLASKEHARDVARRLSGKTARDFVYYDPRFTGDTTSFVAVDREGNAVSFIQSVSNAFGSGLMIPGTGFFLNNRAGRGFNLIEGHPNEIAPLKRTMHTLNCWLMTEGNQLLALGGTPGGDGQPQWNAQLVSYLIDAGLSPQAAVDAPRFTQTPATDPHTWHARPQLALEGRYSAQVIQTLKDKGHPIHIIGDWAAGGAAQIITRDPQGFWLGGSDSRADGQAVGY